jgi:hypothetical protein
VLILKAINCIFNFKDLFFSHKSLKLKKQLMAFQINANVEGKIKKQSMAEGEKHTHVLHCGTDLKSKSLKTAEI